MPIVNRDRFPDVNFLPDDEIKLIGSCEGVSLMLIGHEQGSDALVVAKSNSKKFNSKEQLYAIPLYELLNHTMGAVVINE
jgi:hypothetical protein